MKIGKWFVLGVAAVMGCMSLPGRSAEIAIPAPVKLPLLVWDLNFNEDPEGAPPRGPSREELEVLSTSPWNGLPIKTYCERGLIYITRSRIASVENSPLGLKGRALLLTMGDHDHPQYGPQLRLQIPDPIVKAASLWKFEMDVAKDVISRSGTITLWDIANIRFMEDGTVRCEQVELGRYQPNTPRHLKVEVDNKAGTMKIIWADASPVIIPWRTDVSRRPDGLSSIILGGITPGSYAETPAKIAYDNIRLTLLELRIERKDK